MIQQTHHICVSSHDYLTGRNASAEARTKADVIAFLEKSGFDITIRTSHPRSIVRDLLYGQNRLWKKEEESAQVGSNFVA